MAKSVTRRAPRGDDDADTIESMPPLAAVAMTPDTSLAIALTRAEVDQQITTARAYPREIPKVQGRIAEYACLDDETADECVYAVKRGGKIIRGPSIRFAEIVASLWGNMRCAARVTHTDKFEKWIEAEGIFTDLETGATTMATSRRRIFDKEGRLYNDDMIGVTGAAAMSIAKRNAILAGVPRAIWRRGYQAVERTIKGDVKTLSERRDRAVKAFAAWGVTPERVFAALEVKGLADIGLDELADLTAMRASIKSGEQTVESLFPEKPAEGEPVKGGLENKLGALAGEPDKGEA